MRLLLAALLIVAISAPAQPRDAGSAPATSEVMVQGSARYAAGEFQQAADRFRAAFEANPDQALAHYRFAATVFRALQEDGCRGLSYSLAEAIEHLATSLRLDKALIERLRSDPDFAGFRGTARYHALLGVDTQSPEGLADILPRLKLRSPTVADSGPFHKLEFQPGGAVDVLDHELDAVGWRDVRRVGTWRLKQRVVHGKKVLLLELDAPATSSWPAIHYSGRVVVGPVELVLEASKAGEGPFFASDHWAECCC
jgi:hypothetical protein